MDRRRSILWTILVVLGIIALIVFIVQAVNISI